VGEGVWRTSCVFAGVSVGEELLEADFENEAPSFVTELDVGGVADVDGRFVTGADVVETWEEGKGLGAELAAAGVEVAGAGGGIGSSTGEGGGGAAAAP